MSKKLTLISASLLALMAAGAQAAVDIKIPAKVCDVTAYGADGFHQQIVPNTAAFEKAIDDCASAGGGTVRVPAGNWLVAPFALKSNIRLLLEKNATLVASSEEAAWKITPELASKGAENGWLPFISVAGASNVEISGEGTIDGQGAVWWERWRANVRADASKRRSTDRPRLIYIRDSQNVRVAGLNLYNSPSFHVVMRNADEVEVTRNRIVTPWHAPNTDAIDPINSRNVRITYNYIDCNDDHVAIKAEKFDPKHPDGVTRNIYIAHNTLMQGRGISIGSESAGGVSGVLAEHNTFEGSMYGLRIKSPRGKGGKVDNIVFRDTKMKNVWVPVVFTAYYQGAPAKQEDRDAIMAGGGFMLGDQIYPADTDPEQPFNPVKTPHFSNVLVKNLVSTGKSMAAVYMVGVPEAPMKNVVFENVRIEAERGMLVRNAEFKGKKLTIKAAQGQAFMLQKGGVRLP